MFASGGEISAAVCEIAACLQIRHIKIDTVDALFKPFGKSIEIVVGPRAFRADKRRILFYGKTVFRMPSTCGVRTEGSRLTTGPEGSVPARCSVAAAIRASVAGAHTSVTLVAMLQPDTRDDPWGSKKEVGDPRSRHRGMES